jgi:hypothetical protein
MRKMSKCWFFTGMIACVLSARGSALAQSATMPLSNLPVVAQSSVSAAMGSHITAYHVRAVGDGFDALNPSQTLTTHFTARGIEVLSAGAGWRMRLRGYGYGRNLGNAEAVSPRVNLNRVEYQHGSLTEWYVNGPGGLEQGFTFDRAPGKSDGKPLTIALALSGDFTATVDSNRAGLILQAKDGSAEPGYAGLNAYDADGKEIRAWLELQGSALLLRADDTGARYPIVIDPWIQLAKLTASDGSEDGFGVSVAISGNTIVAGAPLAKIGANLQQGAAYVFVKAASGWKNMNEVAKLTASDGAQSDELGYAVAISGNTVIVGAPQAVRDGGTLAGAAYVFVKPEGGWANMTETAEFTASDEGPGSYFGGAVAISGNTALINGVGNGGMGGGTEYVFVEPASGWTSGTETAQLTSSSGDVGNAAISGDTVVGGSAAFNRWTGAAYVFVKPAGGWQNMTETAMLTDSNGKIGDDFGWSFAISGNTVLVSAIQGIKNGTSCNCGPGKVYVFVKPATGWKTGTKFTAKLTVAGNPAGFNLGYSVSLNGNTAVVGSWPAHFGSKATKGLAYIFTKPAMGWKTTSTPNVKLSPSDPVKYDNFGISVGISGDTIASGANGAVEGNKTNGAAYVFGK